jgi:coenzyme F420-reducing hydrogenase delta subunit
MKKQYIRISLFYCSNSLQMEEIDHISERNKEIQIKSISLPCLGKVNLLYLLKAIETGSDGIVLVSCKLGECCYLQGNFRAQKRVGYVDDLLSETGFGKGRVKFVSIEKDNKMELLQSAMNDLAQTLKVELREV